jgi:hypothetical protein
MVGLASFFAGFAFEPRLSPVLRGPVVFAALTISFMALKILFVALAENCFCSLQFHGLNYFSRGLNDFFRDLNYFPCGLKVCSWPQNFVMALRFCLVALRLLPWP